MCRTVPRPLLFSPGDRSPIGGHIHSPLYRGLSIWSLKEKRPSIIPVHSEGGSVKHPNPCSAVWKHIAIRLAGTCGSTTAVCGYSGAIAVRSASPSPAIHIHADTQHTDPNISHLPRLFLADYETYGTVAPPGGRFLSLSSHYNDVIDSKETPC